MKEAFQGSIPSQDGRAMECFPYCTRVVDGERAFLMHQNNTTPSYWAVKSIILTVTFVTVCR